MTVLGLVGVVGLGLTTAALTARDHATGTAACAAQARAASERVRDAVSRAVVVPLPEGGTAACVVAVNVPDGGDGDGSGGTRFDGIGTRLVVWCGGRGRPAPTAEDAAGRPPRAEELLIFAADPARPWRLVEAWPEGDAAPVDLRAADLPRVVDDLLAGGACVPLTLCDRVRVADKSNPAKAGCVRFAVAATPSADALGHAADDPDPAAARDRLPWAGGVRGAGWGLRTVRVRACVQLTPLAASTSSEGDVRPARPSAATPFFAAAARTYRHEFD